MAVYRTFSTKSQCNLEFRMKRKMYNFLSPQVIYVPPTVVQRFISTSNLCFSDGCITG